MKILHCYMTKTRLIGILAGFVEYTLETKRYVEFYHIDFETYGIDRFEQFVNPSEYQIKQMSLEMFGGLGGALVEIDSAIFKQLLIAGISVDKNAQILDYAFKQSHFLKLLGVFDARLYQDGLKYVIENARSPFERMHYFLMRYVGGDDIYLRFVLCRILPLDRQYTLLRNFLEKKTDSTYRFSALLLDERYSIMEGCITLEDDWVSDFKIDDIMMISELEAAMILKKKEYIYVYDIDTEYVELHLLLENKQLVPMLYENGRLYISYQKHNNHVNCDTFYLNGDVEVYLYITDSEQMLVVSNDLDTLLKWDNQLSNRFNSAIEKYEEWEFDEPIFYDFIKSSHVDFDDYLKG